MLAVKGQAIGRKALLELPTIVTTDTILRWHRELVAKKYDLHTAARKHSARHRQLDLPESNVPERLQPIPPTRTHQLGDAGMPTHVRGVENSRRKVPNVLANSTAEAFGIHSVVTGSSGFSSTSVLTIDRISLPRRFTARTIP